MTQEDYWNKLVTKYPQFLTSGVSFTAKGVRTFFNVVWEMSRRYHTRKLHETVDLPDFFKDIFK